MKPRGGRDSSTKERILEAAGNLFHEHGYLGASTRDIADRVGIRQPSLFHHFPSKAEIMAELQRRDFAPTLALLERLQEIDSPAATKLYFYLANDVRRILEVPYPTQATTSPAALNDPALAAGRTRYERIQTAQTALVAGGIADGTFVDVDPTFASRAIEWMVEGVIVDAHRQPALDATTYAEELASFALRSLLNDRKRLADVRRRASGLDVDVDEKILDLGVCGHDRLPESAHDGIDVGPIDDERG